MYSSLDFSKLDASFWSQFPRSACLAEQSCNCEHIGEGFILQPYSVATSVPSLLLGLYIMYIFRWRIKALGLSFVLTGLGSMLLHGSFTKLGQIADFSGIGIIFIWILLHISIQGNLRFFLKFVALVVTLYVLFYHYIFLRYYVIFGIVALLIIMTLVKKPGLFFNHKRVTFFSITSLFIGFILFRMDINRVFCPEFPLLQGHNLWHLLVFISEVLLLRNLYMEEIHLQEVV